MARISIDSPDVRYVRSARRLRARLADQPLKLHQALRDLAPRSVDAILEESTPALSHVEGPSQEFARRVAEELEGGVLRYSARLSLLQLAAELGIERFEANLIIAAVQYRHPRGAEINPTRRMSGMVMMLSVIVMQIAILAAAWWVVAG